VNRLAQLPTNVQQYLIVTGNYWAFTLTDGALRMLVVLYFHQLGFSPLKIAMLFLFYEFFGVVTNLLGGWLGARLGLNTTMNIGLGIQIAALVMLLVPTSMLSVAWVMIAQAFSGIAKDLNKMSAKSAIKTVVHANTHNAENTLFKWVAVLTGSKNALKGVGFFLGGVLLSVFGFHDAIAIMVAGLCLVCLFSIFSLNKDLGKASTKPKITEVFSKSKRINTLSFARLFLFGARDVWFVVALPVYLSQQLGWQHWTIGTFFAIWIIGYGVVQSFAPSITGAKQSNVLNGRHVTFWVVVLAIISFALALGLSILPTNQAELILVIGLMIFGAVFAVNSSLHSYLIVSYANANTVAMDVGFYYMANAMGRLIGTVLSGVVFQSFGLVACLAAATLFLILASFISNKLPR